MPLRDYLLGILSVPLTDPEVTRILTHHSNDNRISAFEDWLLKVQQLHPTLKYEILNRDLTFGYFIINNNEPQPGGKVGFRFIGQNELLQSAASLPAKVIKELSGYGLDLVVVALCADETNDKVKKAIDDCWQAARRMSNQLMLMEPAWVAGILVEQIKPILADQKERSQIVAATAFFEEPNEGLPKSISVRRVRNRFQAILGTVMDEPGTFAQKWRELQKEEIFKGPILLCTTFLPPVTHSARAVVRFYKSFGATEETCQLIREKVEWERESWKKHISKYERYDIVDRGLVEEYFAAPEYYQMPLTVRELREQLESILELLKYDNYKLCLTPEAVDISYEIRGHEVRIRTDRRNKGQPRLGRISGVVLSEPQMAGLFEREFWSMYRLTESEFKDKRHIAAWLRMLTKKYKGSAQIAKTASASFDVFLCHNSSDKPIVKQIGEQLIKHGIQTWLDEWNLIPGRPWQRALEEQINNIKSVAVFVGDSGLGPWTSME